MNWATSHHRLLRRWAAQAESLTSGPKRRPSMLDKAVSKGSLDSACFFPAFVSRGSGLPSQSDGVHQILSLPMVLEAEEAEQTRWTFWSDVFNMCRQCDVLMYCCMPEGGTNISGCQACSGCLSVQGHEKNQACLNPKLTTING